MDPAGHGFSAHVVSLEITEGPKKHVAAAEQDSRGPRSGAPGSRREKGRTKMRVLPGEVWETVSQDSLTWDSPTAPPCSAIKLWIPSEEILPSDHKATEAFYLNPSLLKEKHVHFLNTLPRTISRTSVSHSSN